MHLQPYSLYLTALAGSMLTPGPAMLQSLFLGLRHGARPVLVVALGNCCVTVVQVIVTLLGLSFVSAHPLTLRLVGLAGAGYLAWLGYGLWRRARHAGHLAADATDTNKPSAASLFLQGMLVGSVNPKAWGFLTALLPPFATQGLPSPNTVVSLATPICLLTFVGMMVYAVCGARLYGLLTSPGAMRRVYRLSGTLLWVCAAFAAVRG